MDIKQYLSRINYTGPLSPTLEVLTRLQYTHLLHVPFENLDIHYNRKIVLDINSIFTKVMHNNRGGFCYELNGLYFELLIALGFDARRISARVWSDTKQAWPPEFDHLAIIVNIEGKEYLTDVGFGDSFFAPLKVSLDENQEDKKGIYRIRKYDEQYLILEFSGNKTWKPCYIFTKVERVFHEFADRCHYQQTSPDAHFVQKVLVTLPTATGRFTLTRKELKLTKENEKIVTSIKDKLDFENRLWEYFKIRLPK